MSDLVLYNDELITFQNPTGYNYKNANATLHLGTASEATYFIDPASGDYAGGVHGLRIYVPIASAAATKGPYGVSGNGYRTYGTDFLNVRYGDTLTMYYSIWTSGQYYQGNTHPYPPTGNVSFFTYALSDVIKVSAGKNNIPTNTTAFGRIDNDGHYVVGMNFSAATAGTTAATTSFYGGAYGYSRIDQNTSAWSAGVQEASSRFTFAPNKYINLYSANGTRASKLGSIYMSAIENYQNMRYSVFIMCDKYTQYVINPFWEGPYGDFNFGYRSTSYRPDVPEFIRY